MKKQFEASLTGAEGPIDGIVDQANNDASAWEFKSIDGNFLLVIAKDDDGNWQRVDGTEPYLSSWIDELAVKIGKKTNH
jgi:hypothetical protein